MKFWWTFRFLQHNTSYVWMENIGKQQSSIYDSVVENTFTGLLDMRTQTDQYTHTYPFSDVEVLIRASCSIQKMSERYVCVHNKTASIVWRTAVRILLSHRIVQRRVLHAILGLKAPPWPEKLTNKYALIYLHATTIRNFCRFFFCSGDSSVVWRHAIEWNQTEFNGWVNKRWR